MTRGNTRLFVFLSIFAAATLTPKAQYLLPITKHEPTKQFYTTLNIGSSPNSPINLVLDLETELSFLNCRKIKSLSTLRRVACETSLCKSIFNGHCLNNQCHNRQPNPLNRIKLIAPVNQDKISFSTISIPKFAFLCAGQKNLQGLSPPANGVLSLSPRDISFPKQVTSSLNVIPKFALCLPDSGTGRFYVGGGSYSIPMSFTPITIPESAKYLINVKSIYVDGTPLKLNPEIFVRAKLSIVVPYSRLQSDIYSALANSFTLKAKAMGIFKVAPVAPFKDCFDARAIKNNVTGPNVPVIEFGFPGKMNEAKWTFYGANTMVKVQKTVMCLAFIDAGKQPYDLVTIGTHQLQDYVVEWDLSRTVLGFSESLLLHKTTCSPS